MPLADSPTHTKLAPDDLGPTITIGEILVEIMATTVGNGFLEPIVLTGPYPSGAPAIFIDQCAKIGGAAGIIAAVGHDDFGRINVDRLRADGADVSAISVSNNPFGQNGLMFSEDLTSAAPSCAIVPTGRAISSSTLPALRQPRSA